MTSRRFHGAVCLGLVLGAAVAAAPAAAAAAAGKELWSADLPGEPVDLAFSGGRLLVVCDSGAVICFGR